MAEDAVHLFNHITQRWTTISHPSYMDMDSGLACGPIKGNDGSTKSVVIVERNSGQDVAVLDASTQVWSKDS